VIQGFRRNRNKVFAFLEYCAAYICSYLSPFSEKPIGPLTLKDGSDLLPRNFPNYKSTLLYTQEE